MTAGDVIVIDGAVGPARQAAAFDGTDDYILADAHAVARVAAADTTGTYSCWMYIDDTGTRVDTFVSVGDNDSADQSFYFHTTGGTLKAILKKGGANQFVSVTGVILSVKTWYHVTFVQDGTSPKFYLNGVLQSSTNTTATDVTAWFDDLAACDKFAIGVKESNGTHTDDFSGMISDVKYWNKALTAEEVLKDYNGEALADDGTYLQLHLLKGDYGIKDQGLGADNGTLTGHAYLCGWGSEWSRRLETSGAVVADSIQTIPYERGRARTVIVKAA